MGSAPSLLEHHWLWLAKLKVKGHETTLEGGWPHHQRLTLKSLGIATSYPAMRLQCPGTVPNTSSVGIV